MPSLPQAITVRKFSYRGDYVTSWAGEVVDRAATAVVLTARWTREATRVGEMLFEPGDLFREYYYLEQPYSLWGVYGADGRLKGWYCNIGLVRGVEDGTMDVHDLILDVLVLPDGRHEVLDRAEFDTARTLDLPDDLAAIAEGGVAAVLQLVHGRCAPFEGLPRP